MNRQLPRETILARESASAGSFNLLVFVGVALIAFAIAIFVIRNYSGAGAGQPITEVTPLEAVTLGDVVKGPDGQPTVEVTKEDDPGGKDKVLKWKSALDGHYYFVSASLGEKQRAADMLAEVYRREQTLLQALDEMMDNGGTIKAQDNTDITSNMKRLVEKHYMKRVPFAELHNPHDKTVGSNSSKGSLIEMCLRNKYRPSEWNDLNTIFRVHVHELSHSADKMYREDGDHGPVFNRIMNHLLQVSENLGIYSCEQYKKSGRRYCGLVLTEEDTKCG